MRVAGWLGLPRLSIDPDLLVDPDVPEAGRLLVEALLAEVPLALLVRTMLEGSMAVAAACGPAWARKEQRLPTFTIALPVPAAASARARVAYYRRLAARQGAVVEDVLAREPAAVAAALESLFSLHAERWRDRADATPRFGHDEAQRDWYRRVVAAFAARGEAMVLEVREDGGLVASVLALLTARGVTMHTTAHRPGGRLVGPGHVAWLAALDAAAAAGATAAHLGMGGGRPGAPKTRLRAVPTPCGRLVIGRSPAGQRVLRIAFLLSRRRR